MFGSPKFVRGLLKPCRGSPSVPRNNSLFAFGVHPLYGKFLRPCPLNSFCFAAAFANDAQVTTIREFVHTPLPFDLEDDGTWCGVPAIGHAEDSD